MAPLEEYLMPKDAEIALARSAAPASIADGATVMVLGRQGYTTAVQGTNGFLCYVERSWAHPIARLAAKVNQTDRDGQNIFCQLVIQSFRSAGVALAGSLDDCKRAKSLIHHLASAFRGH
jgi:hypothetical protein